MLSCLITKKNPMWIRGLDFVAASVPIPVVG
jgi:hypothetical protein